MKLFERIARVAMAVVLAVQFVPSAAYAEEDAGGGSGPQSKGADASFRVTQNEMKWLPKNSSPGTVSDDGKTLSLTANSLDADGTYATAQYSLTFASDMNDMLQPGEVTLRVPAHIFKDRDGKFIPTPVGKVAEIGKDDQGRAVSVTEPSGPEAPNKGTENSFNWTYDKDKDEIVFTNFERVSKHGGFTVSVKYQISSTQVESEASVETNAAKFDVTTVGGEHLADGELNKCNISVKTDVAAPSASKAVKDKYESWQTDAWGPAPAGADDSKYYYVLYNLSGSVPSSGTTQPLTFTFDETKATNPDNTASDEDMLAWTTGSTGSEKEPTWVNDFNGKAGAVGMKDDPVFVTSPEGPNAKDSGYGDKLGFGLSRKVVIRYPRSATENGASPKVSNNYKAIAQGLDGAKKQAAAFASYTYAHVGFGWSGDKWSMAKTDDMRKQPEDTGSRIPNIYGGKQNGGLSLLRAGKPYSNGTWKICIENQQAKVDASGNALPADQQPEYGTVLRDGMLFIDGKRLNGNSADPDYTFDGFSVDSFIESTFVFDPNKGMVEAPVESVDGFKGYDGTYHPITVQVRTRDNKDWHEVGTLTRTGETEYTYGGKTYGVKEKIDFPEGTYDVKFIHKGNQNKVSYRMNLYHTIYPTDHVMGLIGEGTTAFDVFNINDAYLTDAAGKKTTAGNETTDKTTAGIADAIAQSDADEYADGASYHDWSQHTYYAFGGSTQFDKKMTKKEDTANKLYRVGVELSYMDSVETKGAGLTLAQALEMGCATESRETKFYDLLPAGCTVDYSTIKVGPRDTSSPVFYACLLDENGKPVLKADGSVEEESVKVSEYDYTVETVQNWRGTGQTMLIVTAYAPDGHSNFYARSGNGKQSELRSGFKVTFDMIDTYDNIAVNGGDIANSAAIVSQDGSFVKGEPDNGGTLPNKESFAGLNDAGGDLDGLNNCKYAEKKVSVSPTVGSQYAFKKLVKGAQDVAYSESAKVSPTGSYSYQLLAQNDNSTKQSDIVFYDILENKYGDEKHWEGALTGVDTSQAEKLGVDVKVYYSTKPKSEWGDLAMAGSDGSDLDNTAIWSTDAPADLSTVTAVAFDCTKANANADADHKDGDNFVLPVGERMACYLFMEAPAEYKKYQDDPATADVDETVKAYNTAFNKSKRYNGGDSNGTESTTESNKTTVEIDGPSTELDKTSDPASGTTDKPAVVEADGSLTYDLGVKNKNVAEAMTDVEVVDVVPDGLMVDFANIKYYSNGHTGATKLCDGTGLVKVAKDGQKLTFTISKIDANQTIHLVIPTKVDVSANAGMTYDNKAKITKYNGGNFEIESNETYHKSEPVTTSVDVEKKWVDDSNSAGIRPSEITVYLYADGADTGKSVKLNSGNSWKHTFDNLNKFRADGTTEIVYTIGESLGGADNLYDASYSSKTDDDDKKTLTVTNTLRIVTMENVRFTIHKLREGAALSVPGVEFGLYTDKNCNNQIAKQTTDDSGNATFEFNEGAHGDAGNLLEFHDGDGKLLDSITLYMKELSAPHGYTVNDAAQAVTLTRPDNPNIEVNRGEGRVEHDYDWIATFANGSAVSKNGDGFNAFKMSNAYEADPVDFVLKVSKGIEDATTPQGSTRPEEKTFAFTLKPEGDAPAASKRDDGSDGATCTTTGASEASFGKITFTKTGTYQYIVSETNSGEKGYTYAAPHEITVHVVDEGGRLAYTWADDGATKKDEAVSFVNHYKAAPTMAQIGVSKAIAGCPRTEGLEKTFVFHLKSDTSAPLPKNGADGCIATVTDEGSAEFGKIAYDHPGTYLYQITEGKEKVVVDPDDPESSAIEGFDGFDGYVYDEGTRFVQVVVVDNGGELAVDSLQYGALTLEGKQMVFKPADDQEAGKTFVNTYAPKAAKVTIPVTKAVKGVGAPEDAVFEFELTSQPGVDGGALVVPMPDARNVEDSDDADAGDNAVDGSGSGDSGIDLASLAVDEGDSDAGANDGDADGDIPTTEPQKATVSVTGPGTTEFLPISFDRPGTYVYTLAETKGTQPGFTYDDAVHTVKVTVIDEDGELKATWTIDGLPAPEDGSGAMFTNTYQPSATRLEIPVLKTIAGDKPKSKTPFTFVMTGEDDAPMPAGAKGAKATCSVKGEGVALFDAIEFTKAGEYTYQVTEQNGGVKGYDYDASKHKVVVTVVDNAGALQATWTDGGDAVQAVSFTNTYTNDLDGGNGGDGDGNDADDGTDGNESDDTNTEGSGKAAGDSGEKSGGKASKGAGSAAATSTAKASATAAANSSSTRTGDSANLMLWASLLAAAGAAFAGVLFVRRRIRGSKK